MTEQTRTMMWDQLERSIVARPIGEAAVLTVIGAGAGQRGHGLSLPASRILIWIWWGLLPSTRQCQPEGLERWSLW
jgi:hypothetical protein